MNLSSLCTRPAALAAITLTFLLAGGSAALAQATPAPVATGTVRHGNGAAWGTFELFASPASPTGFWMRIRHNGEVMTVMPEAGGPVGGVANFAWINYTLIGGSDPNRTEGWQWVETSSGRLAINSLDASGMSGTITTLATGTQNHARQPVLNPQWVPVQFTIP